MEKYPAYLDINVSIEEDDNVEKDDNGEKDENVEKDAASPMGIKNPAGTYIHSYFNKWGTKVRERIISISPYYGTIGAAKRKMANLNVFCLISHIDAVNTCKKRFPWPFS